MRFLLLVLMLGGFSLLYGQEFSSASESDPQATRILDELRDKFESYPSLTVTFELGIQGPESPEEVQKGKLVRAGDRYKLDLGSQTMLSDGESLYIILHNNQEVQINDIPEEGEMSVLSPQGLFSFYQSQDFVYALVNEVSREGRVVQQIEFKPLSEESEYFKLRLEVDKGKKAPLQMIAFGRDGSRYTVRFKELEPGPALGAEAFRFSKEDYPDYYVEDLRQ